MECVCVCVCIPLYTSTFSLCSLYIVKLEDLEWRAGTNTNNWKGILLGKSVKMLFLSKLSTTQLTASWIDDFNPQPSAHLHLHPISTAIHFCIGHNLHNITGLPSSGAKCTISIVFKLSYGKTKKLNKKHYLINCPTPKGWHS